MCGQIGWRKTKAAIKLLKININKYIGSIYILQPHLNGDETRLINVTEFLEALNFGYGAYFGNLAPLASTLEATIEGFEQNLILGIGANGDPQFVI